MAKLVPDDGGHSQDSQVNLIEPVQTRLNYRPYRFGQLRIRHTSRPARSVFSQRGCLVLQRPAELFKKEWIATGSTVERQLQVIRDRAAR